MPEPAAVDALGRRALLALDGAGVRYCVWKGTGHLTTSLQGDGDVDLLVHADDLAAARQVLAATTHVHVPRVAAADQPGAEDWFGVDAGRFVHLQLYTELYVGDLLTGWRRLPPGDGMLDGRLRTSSGVWIAPPAAEAVVLLLRAAATPPAGSFRGRLARARSHARWQREWRSLLALSAVDDVAAQAGAWLGPELEAAVLAVGEDLTPDGVRQVGGALGRLTVRVGSPAPTRWARIALLAANRGDRGALRAGRAVRRTLPGGGLHVHVHGPSAAEVADGLAAAAAVKLDVLRLRGRTGRAAAARRRGLLVVSSGTARRPADLALDAADLDVASALRTVWDQVRAVSAGRAGRSGADPA